MSAWILLAMLRGAASAQSTNPAPAPTTAPTTTPAPSPGGDEGPQVTITPGLPDSATMNNYVAARTPQAGVVLSAPASGAGSNSPALNGATSTTAGSADAPIQPVIQGGVSAMVMLTPSSANTPGLSTAKTHASSSATSQTPPPPATVTLNYGTACAGQTVWVQTLHGGSLSALDANGKTYNASGGGFFLTISDAGTITFTFQAPANSDVYRVYTRLDNVATTLLFEVPDPDA